MDDSKARLPVLPALRPDAEEHRENMPLEEIVRHIA